MKTKLSKAQCIVEGCKRKVMKKHFLCIKHMEEEEARSYYDDAIVGTVEGLVGV